jgi:hypothetical protein
MRSGRSSDRGPSGAVVDWCWVATGCSPGSAPRTRPGDRTLNATARRRARVWEGARGRDWVAWDVVAGGGAPGRPPAGSRGLPPHAPTSWQEAWVSGRSSARRRSAWRPDRSSGTPQSPWPSPSASAARSGRTDRSDSRRRPLSPPKMRRSEALRPHGKLCPCIPEVNETAHERSSMATAGTAWIHSAIRHPAREGCPADRGVRHQPAATTAARELCPPMLVSASLSGSVARSHLLVWWWLAHCEVEGQLVRAAIGQVHPLAAVWAHQVSGTRTAANGLDDLLLLGRHLFTLPSSVRSPHAVPAGPRRSPRPWSASWVAPHASVAERP